MVTQPKGHDQPETAVGHAMASTVREAWRATASLGDEVDHETRKSAFMLVLEAMLKGAGSEAASSAGQPNGTAAPGVDTSIVDELFSTPELRMDAISSYLEIEGPQARELFELAGTEPVLMVQPNRLPQDKSAAAREIALLVLGARTALGLDTELDDVRETAERFGKYDSESFAETLQRTPDFVLVGKARGAQCVVRLRGVGVPAVRQLAQRLVAE